MKQDARDEEQNTKEKKGKVVTTNFQGEPIYVQEVDSSRLPRPTVLKSRIQRSRNPAKAPEKPVKLQV